MAKNTFSSEFRNLDVDQYNEDIFKDEDVELPNAIEGVDDSTVVQLINAGNAGEALKILLQNAPVSPKGKNEGAKEAHLILVIKVLLSVNKAQMDGIITALDRSLLDVLMKYIYRGFDKPSEKSSNVLLLWHEKVFNISGVGCIVRVLTDRKTV